MVNINSICSACSLWSLIWLVWHWAGSWSYLYDTMTHTTCTTSVQIVWMPCVHVRMQTAAFSRAIPFLCFRDRMYLVISSVYCLVIINKDVTFLKFTTNLTFKTAKKLLWQGDGLWLVNVWPFLWGIGLRSTVQDTQLVSQVLVRMPFAALSFKPKSAYPVNDSCGVKMLDTTEHLVK